ncbi:BnaC06g40970D [Brassica napus]|uniref:BnaC06g40970D protein n=1 Tax=Brassica napus TaxID=3708 RepID=A0A078JGJ0_BRANA|nr:BnaC06g40970D [Brassica napus]
MVLRFLLQLYQEAPTHCLAFTCLDCNNTNAVGVLKTDVSGGDVHCR